MGKHGSLRGIGDQVTGIGDQQVGRRDATGIGIVGRHGGTDFRMFRQQFEQFEPREIDVVKLARRHKMRLHAGSPLMRIRARVSGALAFASAGRQA